METPPHRRRPGRTGPPLRSRRTGLSATPNAWTRLPPWPRSVPRAIHTTNALAEAFNSLFKAELIRNKGPWASINDVEISVAEYVDWFNQRRLHGELGHVPPAEFEALHASPAPQTTP